VELCYSQLHFGKITLAGMKILMYLVFLDLLGDWPDRTSGNTFASGMGRMEFKSPTIATLIV